MDKDAHRTLPPRQADQTTERGDAPGETAPQSPPRVLLAVLAKQKEKVLPFYLFCLEALDYPKSAISLYVRTNNNTDRTADILKDWVARVGDRYAHVDFDDTDVPEAVETFDVHEWNATRFRVLARLRQASMQRALELGCDFYFVVDVDNFIKPHTLTEMIAPRLPIVAPLLRYSDLKRVYSNYHEKIDANGYFLDSEEYYWLLFQRVRGLCQVPVVHCTYLVRSDAIPQLAYDDGSGRHEYVIFSDSARRHGIPQYLDTRDVYGYLTLDEDASDAMKLLGPPIAAHLLATTMSERPRLFVCCGLHSSGSTWLFNLVREICRSQGVPFESLHRESEVNLPWHAFGSRLIVVKSHTIMSGFRTFVAEHPEPVVVTVRDPRDAVVSLMQRFKTSFDEALKTVAASAESLVALSRLRRVVVFRYEDEFVDSADTLARIAAMLGLHPSAEDRAAILAALTPEAVRTKINDLIGAGVIRDQEKAFDRESHWHANHVGDRKIGKFRELLSVEQEREVVRQTREFCLHFGYEATPTADEKARPTPPDAEPPTASAGASESPRMAAPAPIRRPAESSRQTICLSMIVKNEAPVIERCLASVRPLIDYWIIVDTGSTDGTQEVIRRYLQGTPGELHERPWVDFAHNRSEALALARPHGDYTLMIDADDVLEFAPAFALPRLKADTYWIEIQHMDRLFWRPQLIRNALPWRFEGVLHEFLSSTGAGGRRVLPAECSQDRLTGVRMLICEDGARRRSGESERYRRDAAILEAALEAENDPFLVSRYTFYLAQTLMDAGDKERALHFYRRRAEQGMWQQEVFISRYRIARLMVDLEYPDDEAIAAFVEAHRAAKDRAEPLHGAARLCRVRQRYQEGYELARRGMDLKLPADGLFIEGWIYEYGLLDELAVNAYWVGRYDECLKACRRLLATPSLPADYRGRIEANANFARDKLREQQAAGTAARS